MTRPPFIYAPPKGPLKIIHQDDDLLVLDKPHGLLTVPGKHENHRDCLEARAQAEYPEARIVHRLDMDTSGLIILAMNKPAHRHLGLQFERRHTEKTYRARIWGQPLEKSGVINLPLRCDWPNRPLQMVDHEEGRHAETAWEIIAHDGLTSDVLLYPKTGRSHQLRVHMLAMGHPIIGDKFYAKDAALKASDRLCLHAEKLALYHPSGGAWMVFESPCPF